MTKSKRAIVSVASILAFSVSMSTGAQASFMDTPEFAEAVAAAENSDWATDEAVRGHLQLVAEFDSSGPDVWDAEKHPLVYVTSESHENANPDRAIDGSFAGFHIVDANTHENVATFIGSQSEHHYQISRGPHGLGVSPDGQWAYVGWAERTRGEVRQTGFLAVVNMRTLKIDKLFKQQMNYRGAQRSQHLHHIQACTTDDGQQRVIAMWGYGADGGPHHILNPDDNNRVERAITFEDVQQMGHPFTTPSADCNYVYTSVGSPQIRNSTSPMAGVARVNLTTGGVQTVLGTGSHPIGITHTMDGKYTYVADSNGSRIYKIDNDSFKIVKNAAAGVGGPYGIALNWDESMLVINGKGEGTHNQGRVVGILQTDQMIPYAGLRQQPVVLGGSAASVDHIMLHPDPKRNEMWISAMKGWETTVLDLNTFESTAYIPTPNGGDTHSGAFVRYNPDFTGELMSDQGGPKSKEMQQIVRDKAAARMMN